MFFTKNSNFFTSFFFIQKYIRKISKKATTFCTFFAQNVYFLTTYIPYLDLSQ